MALELSKRPKSGQQNYLQLLHTLKFVRTNSDCVPTNKSRILPHSFSCPWFAICCMTPALGESLSRIFAGVRNEVECWPDFILMIERPKEKLRSSTMLFKSGFPKGAAHLVRGLTRVPALAPLSPLQEQRGIKNEIIVRLVKSFKQKDLKDNSVN